MSPDSLRPLLSLIITVYNKENYIEKCLASALNQTLKEIEIICVDDSSSDNSLTILEEYAKNYNRIIKIIRHENNLGPLKARLTGYRNSNGKYLTFLDCDDELSIDFCRSLVDEAEKNCADMVTGRLVHVSADQVKYIQNLCEKSIPQCLTGRDVRRRYWRQRGLCFNWHMVCGKVYKRELWQKASQVLRFVNQRIVMLEDFLISSVIMSYVQKMSTCLYGSYFYFHNDGITANPMRDYAKNITDIVFAFGFVRDFLRADREFLCLALYYGAWRNRYFRYWSDNIINSNLSEIDKENAKDVLLKSFRKRKLKKTKEFDHSFYLSSILWDPGFDSLLQHVASAPALIIDAPALSTDGMALKGCVAFIITFCAYLGVSLIVLLKNGRSLSSDLHLQLIKLYHADFSCVEVLPTHGEDAVLINDINETEENLVSIDFIVRKAT